MGVTTNLDAGSGDCYRALTVEPGQKTHYDGSTFSAQSIRRCDSSVRMDEATTGLEGGCPLCAHEFGPQLPVSFGALLLLLPLFTWLVSHEAARIHEHTKTARQIYQKADDAISDIQANINKGALIEQGGSSNGEIVSAESRTADLRRATDKDIATLSVLLGTKQKTQLSALEQGLDEYWNSIEHNLVAARTQHGQQTFFSELENRPKRALELAGRIDALNQGSLAREEQEVENQQNKLRRIAIASDPSSSPAGACHCAVQYCIHGSAGQGFRG